MHILITNDDGISAEGLVALHQIAVGLTGSEANVTTVAPAYEQSGVGHCISFTKPLNLEQLGQNRYAVDGSPADCVLVGLYDVLADKKPDLVLSGVNKGNNAAQNTLYSGTVGACLEAALQGIPSIALSQFIGPALKGQDLFGAAKSFGVETVRKVLDADIWTDNHGHKLLYNVNFPPVMPDDVKGIKATTQGFRDVLPFYAKRQKTPNGREVLWLGGGSQHDPTAPGTDVHANLDGYVSVTPMQLDLTAHETHKQLQEAFG